VVTAAGMQVEGRPTLLSDKTPNTQAPIKTARMPVCFARRAVEHRNPPTWASGRASSQLCALLGVVALRQFFRPSHLLRGLRACPRRKLCKDLFFQNRAKTLVYGWVNYNIRIHFLDTNTFPSTEIHWYLCFLG